MPHCQRKRAGASHQRVPEFSQPPPGFLTSREFLFARQEDKPALRARALAAAVGGGAALRMRAAAIPRSTEKAGQSCSAVAAQELWPQTKA